MSLPYENATTGRKAIEQIDKVLRAFGCTKFGTMTDTAAQTVIVQFEYRGRQVSVKASARGYAAAWLRAHPYTYRVRCTRQEHEQRALELASIAVYSILRDWIKGQVTAIETGVLSFEAAFLGALLLPNGRTVLEHAQASELLRLEPPNGG